MTIMTMKATQKYHQKLFYELKNQNHLNVLGKQTIALKSSVVVFSLFFKIHYLILSVSVFYSSS